MSDLKLTWIGHATALIEGDGGSILTDPNFSPNVLAIKRQDLLAFDPEDLPPLSAVIISHTHFDHFDIGSFRYIKTSVPVIVPEGSGHKVGRFLTNPIIELSEWSSHEFDDIKIHAMPAKHPASIFCPIYYKRALSYIIEIDGKVIYFAGDSAYSTHFKDIGNTYSIDAALISIGCYKPAFIMKRYHMDPSEALQAFCDLNAALMIPVHHSTFRLSLEKLDEPLQRLEKVATERNLTDKIKIPGAGKSIIV